MSEVSVVSDSLRPHGLQQYSNLGPHDGERVESYPLNHQGIPRFSFFLIVPNREVSIFSCRVDSNVLGFMSLVVCCSTSFLLLLHPSSQSEDTITSGPG